LCMHQTGPTAFCHMLNHVEPQTGNVGATA